MAFSEITKRALAATPDPEQNSDSGQLCSFPRTTFRFLRLPEVRRITGLSKSSIYARIAEGTFPAPVPLGGKAVGWIEAEVNQWVYDRISDARTKTTQPQRAAA
jgi:prophage regulatory protein